VMKLRANHPEAVFGLAELYYGPLNDLNRSKELFQSYLALAGDQPRRETAQQRLQVIDMKIQAGANAQPEPEPEEAPRIRAGGGEDAGDMDFLEGVEQVDEGDEAMGGMGDEAMGDEAMDD